MSRIALVMIARNEERCIARCLESAAPFVDEMIVVDTGSSDATVAIAEALGARVYHFAWIDDFSAARNAALAYSSADWNLILDADEWLDAGQAPPASHIAGQAPFIGLLPVASKFDLQGRVEVAVSWIPRLLPAGVRYRGRIHEQPVSELARRRVPLAIGHDGYRQDQLQQKRLRNETLLLRALDEAPADPYLLYQLGKNYEVYQQYGQAVDYFDRALQAVRREDALRHDVVLRMLFSLKQAGQHQRAIQFAEDEMPNWQHSPDFFFVLGDVLLDWATLNPASAQQQLLPMVESCWLKCLELGEQPALAGAVAGRGSHLAAHNLAVLYDGLGDTSQAAHYRALASPPAMHGAD